MEPPIEQWTDDELKAKAEELKGILERVDGRRQAILKDEHADEEQKVKAEELQGIMERVGKRRQDILKEISRREEAAGIKVEGEKVEGDAEAGTKAETRGSVFRIFRRFRRREGDGEEKIGGKGKKRRILKLLLVVVLVLLVMSIAFGYISLTFLQPAPKEEKWVAKEEKLVHKILTINSLSNDYSVVWKKIPENSSKIKVFGTIKAADNQPFSFRALNKLNYERWKTKATYEAYEEKSNVTSYSFTFYPTREEVNEGLYIIISNYAKELKEEVWKKGSLPVSVQQDYNTFSPLTFSVPEGSTGMAVRGEAKETSYQKFTLYLLDDGNYNLWKTGWPYKALYEGRDNNTYSFKSTITPEQAKGVFWLVVERTSLHEAFRLQLNADVNSYKSWIQYPNISIEYAVSVSWEEKTYPSK